LRLYYHPESDSLFWNEFSDDPFVEDVTDQAGYQDAAALRGIMCPGEISRVMEGAANILNTYSQEGTKAATPAEREYARKQAGGMAGAIQKSYAKWERKPSDFYPTPYDGTESLMPLVNTLLEPGARIWEPCSGDLDMVRVLEWHGYKVTATELRDTGQGVTGFDFLRDDPVEVFGWEPEVEMIVMNPPFSLAAEFIQKALSYTPNVACLVKIDYWNAISRLPLWEKHTPAYFLPLTFRLAFLKAERGNSPLMNCAWVVWAGTMRDECMTEPLRKRVYPGYQGNGVRTSLAKLGQAIDDLMEVISK